MQLSNYPEGNAHFQVQEICSHVAKLVIPLKIFLENKCGHSSISNTLMVQIISKKISKLYDFKTPVLQDQMVSILPWQGMGCDFTNLALAHPTAGVRLFSPLSDPMG